MKPGDAVVLNPAYYDATMSALPEFQITHENWQVDVMHGDDVGMLVSTTEVTVGHHSSQRRTLGLVCWDLSQGGSALTH